MTFLLCVNADWKSIEEKNLKIFVAVFKETYENNRMRSRIR